MAEDERITGDVIKDRYPGDEMQTDDDELVQKSSIISYQESKQEHGGGKNLISFLLWIDLNPFSSNRNLHKTQMLGAKKDKRGNAIVNKLQDVDISQMEPKALQSHLANLREAIAELYLGIK